MDQALLLVTLGALFLAGLVADQIGRITVLPRVTLLLLFGVAIGEMGLDLVPQGIAGWFDTISIVALTMVAFLLGGALTLDNMARYGRAIMAISLSVAIATVLLVSAGLFAWGLDPGLALILGTIATATAPAAMTDVIRQSAVANGFTEILKGIVAVDDAWGLIAFSFVLVLVGQDGSWAAVLSDGVRDLGGAVLLGTAVGVPAAFLTGRLKPGEPLQSEAIGLVFLSAGLALWLEVSFLITGITAGMVIANLARHHDRAFHEIENIQWPFMILFFVLAGASLELEALKMLGWAGALYICLRILARIAGGATGAWLARTPHTHVRLYGIALLPQAGVAVGMALVAGERFPQWAGQIMAFTITSTVIFEVIGPPLTLAAIRRTAAVSADGQPRSSTSKGA